MEKQESFEHYSVLSKELIAGFKVIDYGHYLDVTVGGGGHSELILQSATEVKITAIDRDPIAIAATQTRLSSYYPKQLEFWQGNFAQFQPQETLFDGIIADLGVSSPQFDTPERGFSFRHEAPLDMRMDCFQEKTAAKIINYESEKTLADIFYQYGEERFSRRIARNIVQKRPFYTTTGLAEAIAYSVPGKYRYGKIHPATRTFQALRIVVNRELESLETLIEKAPLWLKPNGIIGIISFHSLEDRLVKHGFRNHELLKVITKKPIIPQQEEIRENPRSRSAKLRFAQRIINQ
ncbi:Ribosomal RNA small subunit methyltransferase H [Hyella patelloides LEGE 07179]|uniref:Ribosomal RNA small subunit methyltransferase H n=1 Tax=Hyella patelloides LEGE 07179 TaxID=945734 RepID=A0A563VPI6_9CYAN|nr:16S rRNA (cytosine(1402)-N(4))-methyltransferase RsmH [Hyella patelloides]VEP13321.1 Ribosomal RNA small subunit methyltransferase H [Hyella patelloides LEGE 07179]